MTEGTGARTGRANPEAVGAGTSYGDRGVSAYMSVDLHPGTTRRFPALVSAVTLLTGCAAEESPYAEDPGVAAGRSAPARPSSLRTTLYFLVDERTVPLGVRRELSLRPGVPRARLALEELLAGPTEAELRSGIETAFAPVVRLRSLRIETRAKGSEAFVDLTGLPAAEDAGAVQKVRVITQVARTLIGLGDIERVSLRVDGRAWGLWDMQGNVRDDPIDYKRLRGFFHSCRAKLGTEAVLGHYFSALP